MGTDAGENDKWANAIGTKSRPIEILIDPTGTGEGDEDVDEKASLRAAFLGLRDGFGFVMGIHGLTVCEYAEILHYLMPTSSDVCTGLSTLHTPLRLQEKYKGPFTTAQLLRLGERRGRLPCTLLESMVVAHQHVLSVVFKHGLQEDVESGDSDDAPIIDDDDEVSTWVGFRYCVILPNFCGMQDYMRVVDDRIKSVNVETGRSTLQANRRIFPADDISFEDYCWQNTIQDEIKLKNHSLYMFYTLLPSVSDGLVTEKVGNVGVYVTISEDFIRGHTGKRGDIGRYYEWILPFTPGATAQRSQTFFLTVGNTLVLPSTFSVRFGAHPTEGTVVFIHGVRVSLPRRKEIRFLSRPEEFCTKELEEFENHTDFLEDSYIRYTRCVRWDDFYTTNEQEDVGVIGTIPSVVNVPLNNESRLSKTRPARGIPLGCDGVLQAYKTNPLLKVPYIGREQLGDAETEQEGVRVLGTNSEYRYYIDNVPYDYYEMALGKPISFPLSLGEVWEVDCGSDGKNRREDSGSSSPSSDSSSSAESESDASA